jgi:diaminopimelate decarboxylase
MKTKSMSIRNNNIYIGEYAISELGKRYKTPLYIYDEIHLRDKITTFVNNFKSNLYECEVIYASKAFIAPYIAKIIAEYDLGVDSVSLGDLFLLNESHFPMDKVLMHGNNKSNEELRYSLEKGIGYIVVDNLNELDRIIDLCNELNITAKVLLRVNPGIEAHTHAYIKTSLLSSKFGESIFDLTRIGEFVEKCRNSKVKLSGFHAHIGSNIHNPESFITVAEVMVDFIKKINDLYNYQAEVLNLGGGFGIKYLETDIEVDIANILKAMTKTIDDLLISNNLKLQKIMIEPGRAIVGDAGITIHEIGGTKKTYGGKNYVFVDGGMTDNIRPALYQAQYTLDIANRYDQGGVVKTPYDVVGKCCESGDILAIDYPLGEVRSGDTLITYSTGAYGYSMASNYNGALKPAVIFVNGKEINMAIKRETLSDLVKTSVMPIHQVFDTHTDILYDLYMEKKAGIVDRFKDKHVNQLQKSIIKGGVWTMYSPNDFDLIEACEIALNEIDLKELPGFNVILGLEGLRNLKKVEDINILYKLGFRHAMLTWNEENKYATGIKGDSNRGVTEEGKRLLKQMEALDMIVDLAHLNEKSFFEALEVTNKNIIYSHGNCRSLCGHLRNVTDEQMEALKAVDGLLGLTLASSFISSNKEEVTLERFLDHVDYAVNKMGINNVCFGFDFMDYLGDFQNANLQAIGDATKVDALIEGLRSRNYSETDIVKLTFNNFFKRYNDKIILRG